MFLPPDFEPVLPAQWFAGEGRWLQPAERLMLAVLTDAIELILEDPAPLGARRRAAEWVRSDDRHWPFSFVNLCETLGLDPERLRTGLARVLTQRNRTRARAF